MRAFVTDGDERPALAITRSLGRRGISVLVGECRPACLASASRYCAGHVTYPSPYRHPEAFRRFLLDFVRRERVDVVLPVTDVTTLSVCLDQERLGRHVGLAAPPAEAFDLMTNKWTALQAAARCGIPIPRTHFVGGGGELPRIAGEVEYPAVVKPVRSKVPTSRGWVSAGVHYAASPSDLGRLYEQTDYLASYPSLIQERISGPGLALFALFDRGELLTAFAHRRLREKPPSGGVSVLCESVPADPRLVGDAERLLGPLAWHGVAMLEYKQDAATGRCFLLEVNGRFWGSLQLAVDAGVDFPYLSYQLALGKRPSVPRAYRVGTRNRWLLGDLDHLRSRLFPGRHPPELSPSRWRSLIAFLAGCRPGVGDQVLSADDPGPFRYELGRYASDAWASAARRTRRRPDRAPFRALPFARSSTTS